MLYLSSLLIIIVATAVLVVLVLRVSESVRRFTWTTRLSRAYLADRLGLLTARVAGLRLELDRRRGQDRDAPAPSTP